MIIYSNRGSVLKETCSDSERDPLKMDRQTYKRNALFIAYASL